MTSNSKQNTPFGPFMIWLIRTILAVIIIVVSLVGFRILMKTAPKHQRQLQKERIAAVEVLTLKPEDRAMQLETTGTVKASRSALLNARVSGNVIKISSLFEPGKRVKAGTPLVELDITDFKIAVQKAKIAVAKAENNLLMIKSEAVDTDYRYKLELGQQDIASYEWKQIKDKSLVDERDKELMLRRPHLEKAEADVKSALARIEIAAVEVDSANTALREAILDLERTVIKAPFDAVIASRNIVEGIEISTQTQLGSLISTDQCWIEMSVPVSKLPWITLPEAGREGSAVVVTPSGEGAVNTRWLGNIIGLLPNLEENGRRARLLVSVEHPFDMKNPLLIGSFVKVSIKGGTFKQIFSIPRQAVHEGAIVWILDKEQRLEFHTIDPVWENKHSVYIDEGVESGELLVITDIASAIPQMKVEIVKTDRVRETEHNKNTELSKQKDRIVFHDKEQMNHE